MAQETIFSENTIQLSVMPVGAKGRIAEIRAHELQIALMAIGLSPGDRFAIAQKAPMGGPIAIKVHGTKIAVRISDAEQIYVEALK